MIDEAYLNGYKVNPIDCTCVDMEPCKEYEVEFGIDSRVTGYDYYAHEEQTEIYSKNMLFWSKHKRNTGSVDFMVVDADVQAKYVYVSSQMSRLQHTIL